MLQCCDDTIGCGTNASHGGRCPGAGAPWLPRIKPCENFDDNGTSPFFNRSSNGCVLIFMVVFGGCNPKTVRFLPGMPFGGPMAYYVFTCFLVQLM